MGKNSFLLTLFLGLVWDAAAQAGGSVADPGSFLSTIGKELAPLIGGLLEFVNLEPTLYNSIAFFTVLGILWLLMYVTLEIGLEKIGLLEYFTGSSNAGLTVDGDKSNSRLIVLTTLILLSTLGSGILVPLVILMINYLIITIVAGVVIGMFYVWVAGFFGLRGKGRQAVGKGKNAYSEGTEMIADAKEKAQEAESRLDDIEGFERDIKALEEEIEGYLSEGDIESVEDIEVLIARLNKLEDELETVERIIEALVEEVEEVESQEIQTEQEVLQEINDAGERLEAIRQELRSGNINDFASPGAMQTAFEEVIDAIRKEERIFKTLKQQEDVLENLENIDARLEEELSFLKTELQEEEQIIAKAENLAEQLRDRDDYQRVKNDLQKSEPLEKRFESLMKKFNEISSKTEKAIQQLKQLEENEKAHREAFNTADEEFRQINEELRRGQGKQHLQSAGYSERDVQNIMQKTSQLNERLNNLESVLGRA